MADFCGENVAVAPTPLYNNNYDVNIRKASNGFIVTVGCRVFVASTWKEVSDGLSLYFRDPKAAEKKYITKK